MVSNRALAIICIESGLHQYLMHDINSLAQSIVTFIDEVQKCKHIAQTDAQRLKYWSKLVAPKVWLVQSWLGEVVAGCRVEDSNCGLAALRIEVR